jgi:hypothetical protein
MIAFKSLLFTTIFLSISISKAGCITDGFTLRDGMAIPVIKCTGHDLDLSIMNSIGGGGLSYWGMQAQRQSYKLSGDDRWSASKWDMNPSSNDMKARPSNNQLFPQEKPAKNLASEMQKSVAQMQKSFEKQMSDSTAAISAVNAANDQAAKAALAQQQAINNQLSGLAAGLAMQQKLIQDRIYNPLRHQIAFEKNLSKGIDESFENAHLTLVQKLNDDLKQISQSENINPQALQQRARNEKVRSVTDEIKKTRSEGQLELQETLSNVADAAEGLAESGNTEQQMHALGAAAMALAGSNALADGNIEAAQYYTNSAVTIMDVVLGFVPIAGSVNDLSQIAFGLATGQDYTGHKMTEMDYGLRALGVVLGIVPAVFLGKTVINTAFVRGAELLRTSPEVLQFTKGLKQLGDRFGSFLEVVGSLTPSKISDLRGAFGQSKLLTQLFSHSADVIQRLEPKKVSTLFRTLADSSYSIQDRWRILTSFEVGTIDVLSLSKGTSIYRWSSNGEIGRYFTQNLISDPIAAREVLALPSSNLLNFLNEYKMIEDSIVISGTVAKNFGHSGGATQIFMNTENILLVRRIK